jgi:hypothetical protein
MNTLEFLAQLNESEKGWGLWINRDKLEEHHVGHYSFDNDRMPKSFVHVASLEELAHSRQKYILGNISSSNNEKVLGQEWAKRFLSEWQAQWSVINC